MAQIVSVPAEERPLGRKSDLKSVRREGKVPAVIYAKGMEPRSLQLPSRELEAAIHRHGQSAILELSLNGERLTALIKELERHPISGRVHHLGLQSIRMSDVIHATVAIVLVGTAPAVDDAGGMVEQQVTDLAVTGRADLMPETIHLDISALEMGSTLRLSDLQLPEGITTSVDPDTAIATTSISAAAREEARAEAEAAAEAAAAVEVAPATPEAAESGS